MVVVVVVMLLPTFLFVKSSLLICIVDAPISVTGAEMPKSLSAS